MAEPEPNLEDWECHAGRTAFFGGRWTVPCEFPTENQHVIISALNRVELCDIHFDEVNTAGLVANPYVGREEAERLAEEERHGH